MWLSSKTNHPKRDFVSSFGIELAWFCYPRESQSYHCLYLKAKCIKRGVCGCMHTFILPVTYVGQWRRQIGRKLVHLKYSVGRELYGNRGPWKDKWVLKQIKPETFLEAKMTILKFSYFQHIMKRQGSLEMTIMLWKIKGSRKEEDQIWNGLTPLKKL